MKSRFTSPHSPFIAVTACICALLLVLSSATMSQTISVSLSSYQYPNGYNLSANGAGDGSINATVSNAVGPVTFLWNDNAIIEDRENLVAGTYSVLVTDSLDSTATATIILTQPAAIQPLVIIVEKSSYPGGNNVSSFSGTNGSFTVSVTGGLPPYHFLWNDGIVQKDRTNLSAGTYDVIVTDSLGTTAMATQTLWQPAQPLTVQISNNSGPCMAAGMFPMLNALQNGGTPPYQYQWMRDNIALPETWNMIMANMPGNYQVLVIDANNNSATADYTLNAPPMMLSAMVNALYYPNMQPFSCESCTDARLVVNAYGGTAPYTYSWSNTMLPAWNSDNDSVFNLGTNTMPYQVMVTDANGCTAYGSYTLYAMPPPPPPAGLIVTGNTSMFPGSGNVSCMACTDGYINLSVSGGTQPYTYNWGNGVTTQNRSNLGTGIYSVIVTDMNGATTTQNFNLMFYAPPPPPAGLIVTGSTSMYAASGNVSCSGCTDGWINLTVSGGMSPYTYNWGNGVITQNRSNLGAGMYSVTVTDMNGATTTQGFNIIYYAPPTPTALMLNLKKSELPGGYNVSCAGCTDGWITADATGGMPPYNFQWNDGAIMQNRYMIGAGEYHVRVVDMLGDSATATVTLLAPSNQLNVQLNANTWGGCNGGPFSGSVNAMVNGGTPPWTYQWSGPNGLLMDTWQSISVWQQGTYSVIVTDANYATAQASITVSAPASVSVQAEAVQQYGENHTGCTVADGVIRIHLQGGQPPYMVRVESNGGKSNDSYNNQNTQTQNEEGFYYNISTSNTLIEIDSLSANWYNVWVNDMSSCGSGSGVELRQAAPPKVSVSGTEYENGYYFSCDTCHDAQMSAVITGGNGNLSYYWFEIPAEQANLYLKGASLFMSENKDFNMNDLPPAVSTSQTATIQYAETLHGLVVADALGCVGFTNFTLEKPKPANAWGFAGNDGAGKWLGTRDSSDLVLKSNNQPRFQLKSNGDINLPDFTFTPDSLTQFKVLGVDSEGNLKSIYLGPLDPHDDPPANCLLEHPFTKAPVGNSVSSTNFAICPNYGNIGIGYYNPQHKLGVLGTGYFSGNVGIGETDAEAKLHVKQLSGAVGVTAFKITSGNSTIAIDVSQPGSPANFRVFGSGDVFARDVRVRADIFLDQPPPDYVFEKDYQLMPLPDLEQYLIKHKHLPEIPSAKDVEKDGYSLGNMNILLLKKVEELTLYLIEQQKELSEQQKEIEQLKKTGNK